MSKPDVKLETGVPIPKRPQASKRESKYPFANMGVEKDNTFFKASVKPSTVHSAITRFQNSEEGKGKKFTLRAVSEVVPGQEQIGEQPGVRVWRTE